MRWWHKLFHGAPVISPYCPNVENWRPRMLVIRTRTCQCGRVWEEQFLTKNDFSTPEM